MSRSHRGFAKCPGIVSGLSIGSLPARRQPAEQEPGASTASAVRIVRVRRVPAPRMGRYAKQEGTPPGEPPRSDTAGTSTQAAEHQDVREAFYLRAQWAVAR